MPMCPWKQSEVCPWSPNYQDRVILRMVSEGKTDKEIGKALHVSAYIVNHKITRLKIITEQPNKQALAAWAVQNGYGIWETKQENGEVANV